VLASALIKLVAATHFVLAGLAFGIVLPPAQYLFLIVFLGFLVILGHFIRMVGSFLVAAVFVLGLFGVAEEPAFAMALVAQSGAMPTVLAIGALSMWLQGIALAQVRAAGRCALRLTRSARPTCLRPGQRGAALAPAGCRAMRRHSSAQRLHASAHSRQWSIECFAHSSAQTSHRSAQVAQTVAADSLPRDIVATQKRHASAQSRQRAMQRAIAFGSASCRQAAAQWPQATAQPLQVSMQDANA